MVSMELRIIARGLLAGDCIHLRSVWPVKVSHIHLPEPTFVRSTISYSIHIDRDGFI
jgi:hypothetical protein